MLFNQAEERNKPPRFKLPLLLMREAAEVKQENEKRTTKKRKQEGKETDFSLRL